jgi:hypothetical protein
MISKNSNSPLWNWFSKPIHKISSTAIITQKCSVKVILKRASRDIEVLISGNSRFPESLSGNEFIFHLGDKSWNNSMIFKKILTMGKNIISFQEWFDEEISTLRKSIIRQAGEVWKNELKMPKEFKFEYLLTVYNGKRVLGQVKRNIPIGVELNSVSILNKISNKERVVEGILNLNLDERKVVGCRVECRISKWNNKWKDFDGKINIKARNEKIVTKVGRGKYSEGNWHISEMGILSPRSVPIETDKSKMSVKEQMLDKRAKRSKMCKAKGKNCEKTFISNFKGSFTVCNTCKAEYTVTCNCGKDFVSVNYVGKNAKCSTCRRNSDGGL